uniref:Progestin and adipoQ receptor family member 3 n=1 Tax=Elaeophora elaphi TaxID=1147741 RepID=A0A0R3S1K2_9BILA
MTNTSADNKCIPNYCKLLRKTELEPCFWINEYVQTGYRPPYLPTMQYVKIFHWNNETINIWSHLIGFFYFTWRQYTINVHSLPSANGSAKDHIVAILCLLGLQICMLLSSFYHIFGSASAERRRVLLRFDTFGVSAGLLSIYLMGIYTAFLCFEEWQKRYFVFLFGISLIAAFLPLSNDINGRSTFGYQFSCTNLTYFIIASLSIAPSAHWIALHGGIGSKHVEEWFLKLLILYGITACAFLFYISMIPERLKPGIFDLVGCSHQWWHLLILAAMWYWQNVTLDYLISHRSHQSFCLNYRSSNITSAN